jgi:cytochrome c biogenesis protein CcmG, thiol:disulfide interchange protein DsbE
MKKKLLVFPIVTFFIILFVFFNLLLIDRDPSAVPSALINQPVPKFQTKSLFNESNFNSSEIFQKEIILVNFFATWCKPCRDEHNYIKRLSKNEEIKIIGINYKDNNKKTINWLKELGNPYSNIALDKNGRIAIDWGVYGIPETFIVNSNGFIKYRHVGPINKKIYNQIISKINDMKLK